ncbi:MAG: rhodanese-like domain-containing protein [Chloroflexi bacterium HGW-Chloroflexi-3]|nr:MAG: rhodanese-like domain-containing protein [Chloroflexi bacterium HGW-Chloroflexi-3]
MSKQVQKTIKKKKNNNIWLFLGGLIIIALAVIIGFSQNTAETNTMPLEVSVENAYQMRENGAFVLDVRELSEWEDGHIPDATLIPLGQLESRMDEIPKDQEVLIVCRSGNRSAQARDILYNAGFTTITSMAGGMNQWIAKSYEVEFGQ